MTLPERARAIVVSLYERHRDLARGDDDRRRELTRMIAEQVRFELGPSWGHKKAGPGNPLSKDAIAQRQGDGRVFAWDLFHGETREPHRQPLFHDITGQVFVDVTPRNHLGIAPEVPAPPAPPSADSPAAVDLSPLTDRLAALSSEVVALRAMLAAMDQTIRETKAATDAVLDRSAAIRFPRYRGSVTLPALGTHTLTLEPDPPA